MPADPKRVESLFNRALALPPADREALLVDEGDDELRARVGKLLAAHAELGAFLNPLPPVAPSTADYAGDPSTATHGDPDGTADHPGVDTPGSPEVGTVIAGKYKLVEEIGEGGMGSVWMARQTEPVKRVVAVKLIKAGMDSKAVLARFEAERQALALMDHPNIAKVLDAGATEDGRPYFVMELVRGVPITKFCDDRKLTPRQRLELFVPMCQAIQHAHQKGVIHRDIKPNNVLVGLYDDRPVPKVIDFGVAKAAGQQLTDKTLATGFGAVVGTPEYMSPEQASFNNLDIDTRSDVYALGALLYELLAGSPPFARKDMEDTGLLELLRAIREQEPPRPSTKLSTAYTLPRLSADRGTDPKRLTAILRGELDWIVMKALEKDRARRYETANGFAADVRRYLAGEPVLAVPPGTGYRLRKFVRRNKAAVAAVSVVGVTLVVLVVTLALINLWVIDERNQKDQALKDKDQALKDKEVALGNAHASALRADAESKRTRKHFLGARIAIRDVITKAALGDGEWSLLPPPLRTRFSEEAIKYYRGLIQDSSDPRDRFEAAIAYRTLGLLHLRAGTGVQDLKQAEDCFRQSIAILDQLAAASPADAEYRTDLAVCCRYLGGMLANHRRSPEAATFFGKSARLFAQLLAERPESQGLSNELTDTLIQWRGFSGPAAVADYKEFLDKATFSPEQLAVAGHSHRIRAGEFSRAGQRQEAEQQCRQALEIFEKLTRDEPGNPHHWFYLADTHRILGRFLAAGNRVEEAEQSIRRAVAIYDKHAALLDAKPVNPLERAYGYIDLAHLLARTGRLEEVTALYQKALALEPKNSRLYNDIAWVLTNSPALTPEFAAKAVDLAKKAVDLDLKNGAYWNTLGVAQYRARNWTEAAEALQKSTALRNGGDSFDWFFLATAHWQLGNKDEARKWYAQAEQWRTKNQPANSELRRFESEAAVLLGITKPAEPKSTSPPAGKPPEQATPPREVKR